MPSSYTTRTQGVEVELDCNTSAGTSSFYDTDSTSYSKEEDDVASISVLAPTRLDQGQSEDDINNAVRQESRVEEGIQGRTQPQRGTQSVSKLPRNHLQQSTLDYLKKFPPLPKPSTKISRKSQGERQSKLVQPSIMKQKGLDKLESQMKTIQRKLNMENQKGDIEFTTRRYSNCIGSFWSNHLVKITILLVLYCLIATAIGGWLAQQFLKIPGLNEEVSELNKQVDSLHLEVDRLSDLVDQLDHQTGELKETNTNLEQTKEKLEEENQEANVLVQQFHEENEELERLIAELRSENTDYIHYTQELNSTVTELVRELANSTAQHQALAISLNEHKIIRQSLEEEIILLSNTTGDLNSTVQELRAAIEEFEDENDRFQTILTFLEDEAKGVQLSYDELATILADTIMRKSALAEIGVKERMKAELAGWECGIITAFGTQQFTKNMNLPIGYLHFDNVVGYVNEKLFQDFCIDSADFEDFLQKEIVEDGNTIWTLNLSDFTRGVNIYTSEVLNYYFPDSDDINALDSEIWDAANYDCNNLSQDVRYNYQ